MPHKFGQIYTAGGEADYLRRKLSDVQANANYWFKAWADVADKLDNYIKAETELRERAENNGFLAEKFRKEVLDLKTRGYTHAEWTKSKDLEAQLKAVQAGADYWFNMWTKAEDREKELKERNAEQAKTILTRGIEIERLVNEAKKDYSTITNLNEQLERFRQGGYYYAPRY